MSTTGNRKTGKRKTKAERQYGSRDAQALMRAMRHNEIKLTDDGAPATDRTKRILANIELFALGKVDTNDPAAVMDRTQIYLKTCMERDVNPTVAGYSLALGIDRTTLFRIRTGEFKRPAEVVEVIQATYNLIVAYTEDSMMDGQVNPVAGIFLMRNNMGYTNNDNPDVRRDNSLGEVRTAESIINKYKDITD